MRKILGIFLILLFLFGCTATIAKEKAEQIAVNFVNHNVKFFTKEGSASKDVGKYKIESMNSYQETNNWIVVMHISSDVKNATKKNDLIVKIDSSGRVAEFNGQKAK